MMNGLMPSAQDGRGKILIFTFFFDGMYIQISLINLWAKHLFLIFWENSF